MLSSTKSVSVIRYSMFLQEVKYLARLDFFERDCATFDSSIEQLNGNGFHIRQLTHAQYEHARKVYEETMVKQSVRRAQTDKEEKERGY